LEKIFRAGNDPQWVVVKCEIYCRVHDMTPKTRFQDQEMAQEPFQTPLRCTDAQIAIARLNKYRSPDNDQILAELIQTGDETLLSAIYKLINSV
jgi:hypothetical protein